ncbi:helix-turn-helix domain-containing protein (plasmid) [Streptomyces sp. NBC_01281]|uniref:helix-turn-helix domain-containing protein n=1 Tax=Streptomyces sp. NBC_01281 TaxID=2903811 RepID=UPI002E153C77|nr:helix-turn-helix domain-containing protein [Streptomyces sp. NBC_01281]
MDSAADVEVDLLSRAVEALQGLLGSEWDISSQTYGGDSDYGIDAMAQVASADGGVVRLFFQVKQRLTPKEVASILAPRAELVRRVNDSARFMVVAPWISPATQQELRKSDIGYLDLTGNVSLRVSRPAIVVHTQGEQRAPAGYRQPVGKPLLTGLKAARLVRLLADVRPPYRATDLAHHAGLSLAYVSRLLDSLEDQLLVRRDGKIISWVEWERLLRARARQTDLFRTTEPAGMIAPNGVEEVLEKLREYNREGGYDYRREVLVTGSYAARSFARISVGGQLMLYVQQHPLNVDRVANELGLIPVTEGADVLLLRAKDRSVFERPMEISGIGQVGLSQLAMDCLAGPGRMPAEGEAVLKFMSAHEPSWRKHDLSQPDETALF